MIGLEAIMSLSLYHASIASLGMFPDSFCDLRGCSGLVIADKGPVINA